MRNVSCGKLSVVIPCYRQGHFLRPLVLTLLREFPRGLEIIVVDDDPSPDFGALFPDLPVRLIRNPKNLGPSGARNVGVSEARGEFIYCIDADDLPNEGALSRVVKLLEDSPIETGVFAGLAGLINDKGERIFPEGAEKLPSLPLGTHLTFDAVKEGVRILPNIGQFVFRKQLWDRLEGFDVSLRRAEDWDFILRWLKISPVLLSALPLLYYRVHDGNGTVRIVQGRLLADRRSIALGELVRRQHLGG